LFKVSDRVTRKLTLVSLFDNDSVDDHLKLGLALSALRDQNVMIVGGGMTVHNLRASMPLFGTDAAGRVYQFTPAFNDAAVMQQLPNKRPKERKISEVCIRGKIYG
jgi:aromatic ring-opening dioxygenase catalytic subunit (LigB family)